MSLQVCHCGWSKVTTYHGLRTHQGLKGCTPKGARIPESQEFVSVPKFTQINVSPPFSLGDLQQIINIRTPTSAELRTHQDLLEPVSWAPMTWESKPTTLFPLLPSVPIITQTSPPTPAATNTRVSVFETPPPSPQTTTSFDTVCRSLDFQGFRVDHLTTAVQDIRSRQLEREAEEKRRNQEKRRQEIQDRKKAEFQLKIRKAEHKMLEVQSSAGVCEDSLDAEMLHIDDVFLEVIRLVEDARQTALRPLKERKEEVRREAAHLVKSLKSEIETYEDAVADLDGVVVLRTSPLTSGDGSRDPSITSVDTSLSFGTLRVTTSTMIRQIQQEVEKLTLLELKRIPTFAVDVKLDPSSAHQSLAMSADGKQVADGENKTRVPDVAGRFDTHASVLGSPAVTSGRAYWEVEVGNKTGWDLGVTRRGANRKGRLVLDPDNGYWVAVHYEGDKYAAMATPAVELRLEKKPGRVGVFVDYEEGVVSFYDLTARSHIYSFTECSFRDQILPYFSPHYRQDRRNAAPLTISHPHCSTR